MVDLSTMTDEEIDAYAAQVVLESGVPDADPGPLAMALKNATAVQAAAEDPYWLDLMNQEAAEMSGLEWVPFEPYTEEE